MRQIPIVWLIGHGKTVLLEIKDTIEEIQN